MSRHTEIEGSEELDEVMNKRKINDIKLSFTRHIPTKGYITYIGFFKDGENILVYFINP